MPNKRYCFVCDKITSFKIDKTINHSCCNGCGSRMGCHPTNAVLIHFQKKIEKIEKKKNAEFETAKIKQLNRLLERQRNNITGLHEKVRILKREIKELKKDMENLLK